MSASDKLKQQAAQAAIKYVAVELEEQLNNVVGVVTNGLFAARSADVALLATADGVKELKWGN